MERKLAGFDAYAVDLRREQSGERADTPKPPSSTASGSSPPSPIGPPRRWKTISPATASPAILSNRAGTPPSDARPARAPSPRGRGTRRALVVGTGRRQGMRLARHARRQMKRELDVLLAEVLAPRSPR
jgi:hypothetical protein